MQDEADLVHSDFLAREPHALVRLTAQGKLLAHLRLLEIFAWFGLHWFTGAGKVLKHERGHDKYSA